MKRLHRPAPSLPAYFCLLIVLAGLLGCGHSRNSPDVSGIPVEVHIERFDTAFFSLDSNQVLPGLIRLGNEYPWFINDFLANILGAGPLNDTNRAAPIVARQFLVSYLPVRDSIEEKYRRVDWLEKALKTGLQHVKYYFPDYALPKRFVTYIGPFDAPGVAITQGGLAIGLQLYAGQHLSFYNTQQGQDMYPLYISRRFEPAFINTTCMAAIAEDIYPDKSQGRPLIEQMIEKGKYWWLAGLLLPDAPDSLLTGFTQKQLDWCHANEGSIWSALLQNTDLFTVDPDLIKNYIGDAPNTQGMPDPSPGNIGQWVGWQIVKKYMAKNAGLTPVQLLSVPARKIFEEARYKPKG
ncbi:MAG: hypothetical protein P4L51_26125 [Puia sp.]|nr:hypothetical protein [Puia sp.]